MGTRSVRRLALALAAPVGALIIAALITSIILVVTGHNPVETFGALVDAFGVGLPLLVAWILVAIRLPPFRC